MRIHWRVCCSKLNEKVTYHHYEFEVLEMDSRRILKVKFTILPKDTEDSEEKE